MAYLGNTPASRFTSMDKQTITGDGGTGYTLDHAVGSEQEIEVFVNNVRQEPSVAYTVAGTALTMTGNVASTDDFYVVFQGKAQQSVTHPSNSALQATTGTFSGDLTVDTDTLYVDSTNNRVGIVNASPTTALDVVGTGQFTNTSAGASATAIKLQNLDNTVASATSLDFAPYGNGTVTDRIEGGHDGSNKFSLRFHTYSSGLAERVRIDGDGNVLVGRTTAGGFSANSVQISQGGSGSVFDVTSGVPIFVNRRTTTGEFISFNYNEGTVGTISTNGTSTAYNTSSDYRLKENVTATWDATTRLKQLNPVRFNFISDADTTVDGFLAHEVQSVVPEAVTGTHNEVDDDGNPVYQGIDQSKLVPLLVKTIQELEARIVALENA